jgi:hypothetical protein
MITHALDGICGHDQVLVDGKAIGKTGVVPGSRNPTWHDVGASAFLFHFFVMHSEALVLVLALASLDARRVERSPRRSGDDVPWSLDLSAEIRL